MAVRSWSQIIGRTEEILGIKTAEDGASAFGVSRQTYSKWKSPEADVLPDWRHVRVLADKLIAQWECGSFNPKTLDDITLLHWACGIRDKQRNERFLTQSPFREAVEAFRANKLEIETNAMKSIADGAANSVPALGSLGFLVGSLLGPVGMAIGGLAGAVGAYYASTINEEKRREMEQLRDKAAKEMRELGDQVQDGYRRLIKDLLEKMVLSENEFEKMRNHWLGLLETTRVTNELIFESFGKQSFEEAKKNIQEIPSPLTWFDIDKEILNGFVGLMPGTQRQITSEDTK